MEYGVTRTRFILPPQTPKKLNKIHETPPLKTLYSRQRRTVPPETGKTKVSFINAPACFLEKVSGLRHQYREVRWSLVVSRSRGDRAKSLGKPRQLEFTGRALWKRKLHRENFGDLQLLPWNTQVSNDPCMYANNSLKPGQGPPESVGGNNGRGSHSTSKKACSQGDWKTWSFEASVRVLRRVQPQ